MALMMSGALEDTICAIATPAGEGGIGIVRLSGARALAIANGIVQLPLSSETPPAETSAVPPRGGNVFDEALVVYMKGPRSFTGEDTVEIQSHGGWLILSLVCRACLAAGARMAA